VFLLNRWPLRRVLLYTSMLCTYIDILTYNTHVHTHIFTLNTYNTYTYTEIIISSWQSDIWVITWLNAWPLVYYLYLMQHMRWPNKLSNIMAIYIDGFCLIISANLSEYNTTDVHSHIHWTTTCGTHCPPQTCRNLDWVSPSVAIRRIPEAVTTTLTAQYFKS